MTSTNWIGSTPRGHTQFPARSRHRDLPGADLRGCEEISDFLRRYGTEHAGAGADFGAVGGRAVIVGASSVSFEAARLLLSDADALASSDVNGTRGLVRRRSVVREVVVLSPSDAGHAEYTFGDLSALMGIPSTEVVIARGTQESDASTKPPASAARDARSRTGRGAAAAAAPTLPATKRRIVVRHLTPALEILASRDGRVAGVRAGRNLLVRNENGQVRAVTFPGVEETIPCGVVLIARQR
jgi:NADPH-dependent glutamate synthase beta subunit-like oxidoreductase